MVTAPNPKPAGAAATGMPPKPSHSRQKILVAILILGVAVTLAVMFFNAQPKHPTELDVNGRIEGYETNVGPKIGGRVDFIGHREGEEVKRGELIVQISDDDIQAQLRGAEARIKKATEGVEEAKSKLEVVRNQIDESKLKVDQSAEDAGGRVHQWESTVASDDAKVSEAEASLAQSKADFDLARIRRDRYQFLVSKQAVTKDEYDQAVTTFNTSEAVVNSRLASLEAAKRVLKADRGQLTQAKATKLNPHIQSQEVLAYQNQLIQARHELKSAEHEVANATADRDSTTANLAYLKILSPIDGVVTARAVEPGAVVVPGQTLLSLIDLSTVYLRGYVPEGDVGNVRIGQKSKVYLDSKPDQPFEGEVVQIDPQGSFTPENIYFKNDRIRQVFGIKIAIHQPGRYCKPGMPADAKIDLH
jgi:HlyD family secretion protein